MASEIDMEQTAKIASLTKDVELLRGEVAKYKDKEHQQFNGRISKLEKWVWGCSAVLACVVTVGGILPKFIDIGGDTDELWWRVESNRDFIDSVVIPSFKKPNWQSQFFDSWDAKGAWKQYE